MKSKSAGINSQKFRTKFCWEVIALLEVKEVKEVKA